MQINPSNAHAAAAAQQARGHTNAPKTTAEQAAPQSHGNSSAMRGHGAPLTTGATAVNAQAFAAQTAMAGPAMGKSGDNPAAIARQIAAGNPEYSDMPFGKVVSQVARGILDLDAATPAAPAADPAEALVVDAIVEPAEIAAPVEADSSPAPEAGTETTTAAAVAQLLEETSAAQTANTEADIIEAFAEAGGVDIQA